MALQRKGFKYILLMVFLGLTLVLAGCGGGSKGDKIVIGTQTYTEPTIIGNMLKILIEENTDLNVEMKTNLGASSVTQAAIEAGEIDIYGGYTGTALTGPLGVTEKMTDPQEVYDYVKSEFEKRWNITWLEPYGFQNTYALAMRRDLAEELGVKKVSDLKGKAENLTLGTDTTFLERQGDGYAAFSRHYGFDFKEKYPMEISLVYKAAKERDVDVVVAYSTDARIALYDLVILEDDKQFFPPYHMATVIRQEVLDNHPGLKEVLNKLGGQISEEEMQQLNLEVDEKGRDHEEVAREFLAKKGLIN
ncbi:MAG TPA: osmoprotectant ABC transporter substrate-binding protein [Clostridia bacterium]|jgi:osmoprotectant transport system substrate-binding protein|nr:osmoprotectant ABC transporter substrate-binding protein [Clostridia bacterium]